MSINNVRMLKSLFFLTLWLQILCGLTSYSYAQVENSHTSDLPKFLLCCLFMFPRDNSAYKFDKNNLFLIKNDRDNFHIIDPHSNYYPYQCKSLVDSLNKSDDDLRYYPQLLLARICEVTFTVGGKFNFKMFGRLPFLELEERSRYRALIFSRLGDFSISRSDGMTSSEKVLVEITLNINLHKADSSKSDVDIISISCRGRWRNFFSENPNLQEAFSADAQSFSVNQNDECESVIKNMMRNKPSLIK